MNNKKQKIENIIDKYSVCVSQNGEHYIGICADGGEMYGSDLKETHWYKKYTEQKSNLVRDLNQLLTEACTDTLYGFVEWLINERSGEEKYWFCPKCETERTYFSKHDSEYCEFDGRKKVLKIRTVIEDEYIPTYEIREILEQYKIKLKEK